MTELLFGYFIGYFSTSDFDIDNRYRVDYYDQQYFDYDGYIHYMKRKMKDESESIESGRNGNDQTPKNDSIILVSGSSTNYDDELERILNRKRMKKIFPKYKSYRKI